jgi:hypothetical protein
MRKGVRFWRRCFSLYSNTLIFLKNCNISKMNTIRYANKKCGYTIRILILNARCRSSKQLNLILWILIIAWRWRKSKWKINLWKRSAKWINRKRTNKLWRLITTKNGILSIKRSKISCKKCFSKKLESWRKNSKGRSTRWIW